MFNTWMERMKKIILTFGILVLVIIGIGIIFISGCAQQIEEKEDTEKFGVISSSETWSGVVRVTGDILVENDVTLTILPGTKILISANSDKSNMFGKGPCEEGDIKDFDMLKGINEKWENMCGVHKGEPFRDEGNHITIQIGGELHAVGTSDEPIIIKSDAETPGRYDWNHFIINNGILSYTQVSNYRTLEIGSNVKINHNTLSNIGELGLGIYSNNTIEYNKIFDSGHELIGTGQASPIIRYNILGPNPAHAGIIIEGGNPIIEHNHFIETGGMIVIPEGIESPTTIKIMYNTFDKEGALMLGCVLGKIEKNNIYCTIILTGSNCPVESLDLSNNYWGTTDKELLYKRLVEPEDLDLKIGRKITYEPYLTKAVEIGLSVSPTTTP
jgi:hypothetical protein